MVMTLSHTHTHREREQCQHCLPPSACESCRASHPTHPPRTPSPQAPSTPRSFAQSFCCDLSPRLPAQQIRRQMLRGELMPCGALTGILPLKPTSEWYGSRLTTSPLIRSAPMKHSKLLRTVSTWGNRLSTPWVSSPANLARSSSSSFVVKVQKVTFWCSGWECVSECKDTRDWFWG